MSFQSYLSFDYEPGADKTVDAAMKQAFADIIASSTGVATHAYATLGLKTNTRFMLHCRAESPELIQNLIRDLLHTPLGKKLRLTYTMMGMTRPSQYRPDKPPKESSAEEPHRYLTVYPFTKTIEWHLLPFEERRSIMKDHVDIGRKYSSTINQLLLYAYGIDDHEFIVSYQMDSLEEFQSLVMELRNTEGRRYTKNDLPIFTGIHMPIMEALSML